MSRYRNPLWAPEYTGRKPSFNDMGAFRLNRDHPLNQGLVGWWLLNEGASIPHDLVLGEAATMGTTAYWGQSEKGATLYHGGTTDQDTWAKLTTRSSIVSPGTNPFTLYAVAKIPAGSGGDTDKSIAQVGLGEGDSYFGLLGEGWTTNVHFEIRTGWNLQADIDAGAVGAGWHSLVGVRRVSANAEVYCDGALANSGADLGGSTGAAGRGLWLLGHSTDTYEYDSIQITSVMVFNRALSATEIRQLHINLYGTPSNPRLLVEPRRTWFVPSAAGAAYTLDATSGSYSLSGKAASLLSARKLASASGSFALTGKAAALLASRKVTAAKGEYALTGNAAVVRADRKLTGEDGEFTLTGNSSSLLASRRIAADSGTYLLTGNGASLRADRRLLASFGEYILSGQPASLNWSGSLNAYTLTAETGVYVLSGQAARLLLGHRLASDSGQFTFSGKDAALLHGRRLVGETGEYVLTGEDADFWRTYVLDSETGVFLLRGKSAGLIYSGAAGPSAYWHEIGNIRRTAVGLESKRHRTRIGR